MRKCLGILAGVVLLLASRPVTAEEPHLEFVRGLRAKGFADLALEYLEDLSKKPPAHLAPLLPLEIAKTQLDLAEREPDPARRASKMATAREGLETFLKANAKHPLAAEANLEVARLIALQGKTQLSKAARQESRSLRKAENLKARVQFEEAGKKFDAAITQITAQIAKYPAEPATAADRTARQALVQARIRAEFEQGMNLFDIAQTYDPDNEVVARGGILDKAVKSLRRTAANDTKHPTSWIARAWIGKAYIEIQDPANARKEFDAVIKEEGDYTEAGKRLARYFQIALIQNDPTIKNKPTEIQAACREWLTRYRPYQHTAEGYGVRFELAKAIAAQAAAFPIDKQLKKPVKAALDLYEEAKREYKHLEATENDYTERARQARMQIILISSADRFQGEKINAKNFEEAHLWAQYEAYLIGEEEKKQIAYENKLPPQPDAKQREELAEKRKKLEADRKLHLRRIVLALEQALELADEKTPAGDVIDVRLMLTFACLNSGDLYRAAIIGEHLARTEKQSPRAAAAGTYALQAYAQLMANSKSGGALEDDIQADRERVRILTEYMETTWPTDPATDDARFRWGSVLLREENYQEGFEALARITPVNVTAHTAYQLAQAAFKLQDEKIKMPPEQRKAYLDRATALLEKLPDGPTGADVDSAHVYVLAKLALGRMKYAARKYDEIEPLADKLTDQLKNLNLTKSLRDDLEPEIELIGLYARYGRVYTEFQAGNYTKVLELTGGQVKEFKDRLAKKDLPEERVLRMQREILWLALRAEVAQGNVAGGKEVLALLQKSAASAGAEGGSTAILLQLVRQLQEQVTELRRKGPKEQKNLEKTIASFTTFVGELEKAELAKKPEEQTPEVLFFLAQSYSSLDKHTKAAELLAKYPEPKPDKDGKIDPKKESTYKFVRLSYARELRQAKKFDDAKKVLDEISGTKEKPGWGANNLEVRMERIMMLEDQEKYGGKDGSAIAWNALMTELRKDLSNAKVKEIYYECYYHLVFSLARNASKIREVAEKESDGSKKSAMKELANKQCLQAAGLLAGLEQQKPDLGGQHLKDKYEALLEGDSALKEKYLEEKKKLEK